MLASAKCGATASGCREARLKQLLASRLLNFSTLICLKRGQPQRTVIVGYRADKTWRPGLNCRNRRCGGTSHEARPVVLTALADLAGHPGRRLRLRAVQAIRPPQLAASFTSQPQVRDAVSSRRSCLRLRVQAPC